MHDTAHISALLRRFIMHVSCLTCYLAVLSLFSPEEHVKVMKLSRHWLPFQMHEIRHVQLLQSQTDCRAFITIKYRTNQLKTTKSEFFFFFYKIRSPPCINQQKGMFCSRFTDLLLFDRKTHRDENVHAKVSHLNVILYHFHSNC